MYPARFRAKIREKVSDVMGSIVLRTQGMVDSTVIPNKFIDEYMPFAHGDYVKVYIYLLRCLGDAQKELSVSSLADRFENTEKDIIRAVQYWEQKGLLKVTRDQKGEICEILLVPLAQAQQHKEEAKPSLPEQTAQQKQQEIPPVQTQRLPVKDAAKPLELEQTEVTRPVYTPKQIACIKQEPQVEAVLDQLPQMLRRYLTEQDVQIVCYIYESLGFSQELILYLFQHCVSRNITSSKYAETIAISWNKAGVRTVEQAKKQIDDFYHKGYQQKVGKSSVQQAHKSSTNKFTSFEQHKYSKDDMAQIEKAMLYNSEKKMRRGASYGSYK